MKNYSLMAAAQSNVSNAERTGKMRLTSKQRRDLKKGKPLAEILADKGGDEEVEEGTVGKDNKQAQRQGKKNEETLAVQKKVSEKRENIYTSVYMYEFIFRMRS